MSMMGELKFFPGIQIDQCKDGVYVHQSKYARELLKKFNFEDCKLMATPMLGRVFLVLNLLQLKRKNELFQVILDLQLRGGESDL